MAKKETKKELKKKEKNKKGALTGASDQTATSDKTQTGIPNTGANPNAIGGQTLDHSQITAEQLTQAQIEQAIKESQDPSTKLKKLRSPIGFRSCLLNLLILVVLTIGIVLLVCYIQLDKETFNLLVVIKDMLNKFGITDFFNNIGAWFVKVFSGGKG